MTRLRIDELRRFTTLFVPECPVDASDFADHDDVADAPVLTWGELEQLLLLADARLEQVTP